MPQLGVGARQGTTHEIQVAGSGDHDRPAVVAIRVKAAVPQLGIGSEAAAGEVQVTGRRDRDCAALTT